MPSAEEIVQGMIDKIIGLEEDNEQLQDALFRFMVAEDDGLMDVEGFYMCVFEGSNESFEIYVLQTDIDGDCIYFGGGRALIAWAEKPTYTP